ncbi:MAG: leucyl/phenylalanyl-tRNA--protein transferase [Planctomycetes bacterium]|jgi:leucyl/phenylalanyl-tRNA--protein transferase|nr:leucyl/phenylalanyl-tRNA--protein transferase [Planctomycetota bacterium]
MTPAPDSDILAALEGDTLLTAYANGIFPMVDQGELLWFSPDPRGLLPLDERFHVSRSLQRTIRRGRYVCTVNRAFRRVVGLCGERGDGGPTWISPEIAIAYTRLHLLGFAHSVEAWPAGEVGCGEPVGGLYGVSLGGAFFAESMFHRRTDAGKVALVHLIERLRRRGFVLCDVQWTTDNLRRFGAFDLPRDEYLALLAQAVFMNCRFA